jgi:hypothetical protein
MLGYEIDDNAEHTEPSVYIAYFFNKVNNNILPGFRMYHICL